MQIYLNSILDGRRAAHACAAIHPDLYGYGDVPAVLIKDQLKIPATLKGDYVLSWRWDCEQTDQIWSTCADITVTA